MELDKYQEAAATTNETRVLVSAVPGSGKTRTLAARFKYMVEKLHITPPNIVMITFTRYAANEIRSRLPRSTAQRSFIGTFHSLALALIKMYGNVSGWEGHWLTLLDEKEVELEQMSILKDMGFINARGTWSRCKSRDWVEYRARKLSGAVRAFDPSPLEQEFDLVWSMFMDRLRAENVLTFGSMILEAMELLKIQDVQEKISKRFPHVLLDEAQDTDKNQWDLVKMLNPDTLFVVGDGDQAIFEWRGACPQLFREYAQTAKRYDLPNSYRFGINIAAPANALIHNNVERIDTAITAIAENEGTVTVVQDAAYDDICSTINEQLRAGYNPAQIAVLSRRHSTLAALADVLKADNVPFTRVGGQEAVPATSEFRTLKGYLRLSVNPKDSRAFMAIATAEGLSNEDLWMYRAKANDERISIYEAYGKELPVTLSDIQQHLHAKDPYTDYLPAIGYMREVMHYEAITETQELLEYLAMESMQDQLRSVENTITLCTVHASKGLEWPVVLVIGLNAKQFPSPRSVKEGRVEEERRLCYVAMTRAEEKLYLVQGLPETVDDSPSIFLGELGDWVRREQVDIHHGDDLRM